jgi:hypothetical protein
MLGLSQGHDVYLPFGDFVRAPTKRQMFGDLEHTCYHDCIVGERYTLISVVCSAFESAWSIRSAERIDHTFQTR